MGAVDDDLVGTFGAGNLGENILALHDILRHRDRGVEAGAEVHGFEILAAGGVAELR